MKIKNIALEGTHCSGKTTIVNKFKKYQGKEVFIIDEMIRKLDGFDTKIKFNKLVDSLYKVIADEKIRELVNEVDSSLQEGSFRFHLNNCTYEDINTYFFSEDVLINLYFGLIESLKNSKAKNIYLFQENTKFLYDRCFLSPLYYMRYFMNLEEVRERLQRENIKKLKDMYRSAVDRVCKYRDSCNLDDWLFLILKPLSLDINDDFRLKGDQLQQDIYNICLETFNVLDIDYIECDQKEAEHIINNELFGV